MPTYALPNGSTTDDEQLHLRLWQELAHVVESLVPGAKVARFDAAHIHFTVVDRDQLTLPVWLIQTLAKTARPMNGRGFKLSAIRTQSCETCGVPVHSSGAGRTRRFCGDCSIVRAKLRAAKEAES